MSRQEKDHRRPAPVVRKCRWFVLDLLTVKEAAQLLRLSPAAVYALCACGALAHYRLGVRRSSIRIARGALATYLDTCHSGENPPDADVRQRLQLSSAQAAASGFTHLRPELFAWPEQPLGEGGQSSAGGARNAR